MSQEEIKVLATRIQLVSIPSGPIFKENDPSEGLYIIKSGAASVTKSSQGSGVEAVLNLLRPGQSFGEIGLIDGLPRTATVTAMGPMECYVLGRDTFLEILDNHPRIAMSLVQSLAAMVRNADEWVARAI
jgi:CRP-like cAMP-binding protein